MKKTVFLSFAFCSISLIGFAQNQSTDGIETAALWLQGEKSIATSKSDSKKEHYFNFNPVFSSGNEKDLVHKNILKNKYSLFLVFKSDLEEEVTLVNLKSNGTTTTISNKQLVNEKNNTYQKVDAKQGMLLTYIANHERKGRNKSSLVLENLSRPNTQKGYRNDLMELLYYPRVVSGLERQKIQSHLSIKYGISLLGEVDYLDSEGKKVWDAKENKLYNNRVTGIGKDAFLGLDQKQSGNAQNDGLYIGLGVIGKSNMENPVVIPERAFLLWGDNNGKIVMESDKKGLDNIKKMKRVWKMQSTNLQSEGLATQVMLDKNAFSIVEDKTSIKRDDYLWLVIDRNGGDVFDYHNAEYYMQSKDEDGKILFNDVIWDIDHNGADSFTFVKGPDFFVDFTVINPDCDVQPLGEAKLKIVGGTPPFHLEFTAPSYSESHTISERSFALSDLVANNYAVHISDKMLRTQKDTLMVNGLKGVSISLQPQWYLNSSNEAIVIPQIENPDGEKLGFTWKQQGTVVSKEKQFSATEEGDYTLTVSNEMGCENEFAFRVSKSVESSNGWMLYPNPAKMDQPFKIRFDLEKESDVSVAIFDFANKLLKGKKLGNVKEYEYSETLSSIGTFLIVVTIDGKAESTKIIVR